MFSCKPLAYLLSLSLQRLQVVGHSFQLLFKLSTFAVISEGRQERGAWEIQSSKRNRRKQGEKIEKNENNYRAKERPQKQLNPSRIESNSLRCRIPFQVYIKTMTRQKSATALGLHRNIYIAFTRETVQLLFGCTGDQFKRQKWINKQKRDHRKPPKQDAKRAKSVARSCYYWVS